VANQAQNNSYNSVENINVDRINFRYMHITKIYNVCIFVMQNKLANARRFSQLQGKTWTNVFPINQT
jgi:hypothetical protein